MVDKLISNATKRNWERLATDGTDRLVSRANKKLSHRFVVPKEYFIDRRNIKRVEYIRDYIMERAYATDEALFSLAVNLLRRCGIDGKAHVCEVLKEYDYPLHDDLLAMDLPSDELDLLGIIYQCLLSEGAKNVNGAYYTPASVVRYMTSEIDLGRGQRFLDPCCGTGAFLLLLSVDDPTQLYGMEIDRVAAMIARVNLLMRYSDFVFIPNIRCADFLTSEDGVMYDYIFTNPPWGSTYMGLVEDEVVTSGETFSYFIVKAYAKLSDVGVMRFLLPESVLNVKAHKDIRRFILEKQALRGVTFYDGRFSGVVTRYIDLTLDKNKTCSVVRVERAGEVYEVDSHSVGMTENCVFSLLRKEDRDIIEQVKRVSSYTLADSVWALGIVTGDNKQKLRDELSDGLEPIYTGKEIMPYCMKPARRYIKYERENFQQVAKDEIYRSTEKLVYRFISDKLTFAYDNTGALFLNSANILIPDIPCMNIKTVMAFLNSRLFKFLYVRMFNEIKILKGNLMQLPFPAITAKVDNCITACVDAILKGDTEAQERIDAMIYQSFRLTPEQIRLVEKSVD